MFYLRSKRGTHIVTFNGSDYEFDSLRDAWNFIKEILGGTF